MAREFLDPFAGAVYLMPTPLETFTLTPDEPVRVQIFFVDPDDKDVGAWVTVPRLRVRNLRWSVQPHAGVSSAELEYEYGRISIDGAPYEDFEPLGEEISILSTLNPYIASGGSNEVLQHAFRILMLNDITGQVDNLWCGFCIAVTEKNTKQPRPPETTFDTTERYGTQILSLAGPEWLLTRKQVTTSRVLNDVTGSLFTNKVAIPFNMAEGRVSRGSADQFANRSSTGNTFTTSRELFDVAKPLQEAVVVWTGENVADYMHANHLPTTLDLDPTPSPAVSPTFTWAIDNEEVLATFEPQFEYHGETVKLILDKLADPRRFLNYAIDYSEGASDVEFGTFTIRFNSASGNLLSLPNGTDIPANPNTVELNTSGTIGGRLQQTQDSLQEVSQVIVQGARLGYVTTRFVGVEDDMLLPGWDPLEEEQPYKEGAAATMTPTEWTNILDTDYDRALKMNDLLRRQQYGNVYTRFVCPVDFDFSLNDFSSEPQYVPGLRWSRTLPLKEGWDYSVDPPVAKPGASQQPEYRTTFAVYAFDNANGLTTYAYHNTLSAALRQDAAIGKPSNVVLRPLEDTFGISLVPDRMPPHWQAKDESGIADTNPDEVPAIDYRAALFTGYFQEDAFVEGVWPATTNDTVNASTLVIRLGDTAFFDVLMPETVVDIESKGTDQVTELVESPGFATILRDDRNKLQDIAKLAYQWYGQRRYAYAVSYAQIVRDVKPGYVADVIDGQSTDVVITEIAWDFDNRQTSIATAFAEPDFRLLL